MINVERQDHSVGRWYNYPRTDLISKIDSSSIWATIPFQGYDENAATLGYGEYLTYYAQGRQQLRKPMIILDGFDPKGSRGASDIYEDRLSYILNNDQVFIGDELRKSTPGNGYDIVILNAPKYAYTTRQVLLGCFPQTGQCQYEEVKEYRNGGADYVERNAMALVALINRINQQLTQNGSTEKIAITGPSMGSLISRYALAYMEKNGMNHNCKLWVSFDGPHNGANVNLGIQFTTKLLDFVKVARDARLEKLDSPAARQMMIQHYSGVDGSGVAQGAPGFRERFKQVLNDIGYPQAACLRKVSLVNGSKNGTFQNFGACQTIFGIQGRPTKVNSALTCWVQFFATGLFWKPFKICNIPLLEVRGSTGPSGNNICSIARRFRSGVIDLNGEIFLKGNGQPSLDIIPGSNFDFYSDILGTKKSELEKALIDLRVEQFIPKTGFIPTFSSYGLKNIDRDWGASLSSVNIQTETPFDALYAPNENQEHTEMTKEGFEFIKQQLAIADQQCVASLPLSNGCYTIKAKHSNKFMQPENNNSGARVRQYGSNGQSNQKFQLEAVDGNAYKITSQSSGKIWEAAGANSGNGTAINVGDWSNANHEKWNITAWGDGTYKLEPKNVSGRIADIEGVSTGDGAGLTLWDSHSGDNQRFYFASTSCGGTGGTGTGLTGNYFNNKDLTGSPLFSRVDETINFPWDGVGPGGGIGVDNFSVRWEGQVEAPYTGTITFKTNNDDGTRLWVNGQQLINNWADQPPTWQNGSISLTAGQKYNIKMEYYEHGGGAQAQLFWEYQGQSSQIVPKSRLYPSGDVNPPVGGTGTGLTGNYYNNNNLQHSPMFSRVDPVVDFVWNGDGPGNGVGNDNFSVRWIGQVQAPVDGQYTFAAVTDDGIRLWVNNQPLIDYWSGQSPTERSGTISLNAGVKYNIKMEYFEGGGGAQAQLKWSYPGQGQQIIPQSRLYPDGNQPCSTPAAPGVNATGSTVCAANSQTVTLSTSAAGSITWYKDGNSVGSGSSYQANQPGSYTATTSVNSCTSPASSPVSLSQANGCSNQQASNCGFSLQSATQNSGQYTASFQFYSCSVSQVNWSILSGSTVIASGTENVTSSTVPFTVPASVNSGGYTLKVDVVNCSGTGTVAFNYTKPGGGATSITCQGYTFYDGQVIGNSTGDVATVHFVSGIPEVHWNNGSLIHFNWVWALQNIVAPTDVLLNCLKWQDYPYNARMSAEGKSTTSSAEQENDELMVSPNPSHGEFYAQFRLEKGQKATLQLLDVNGRTLHERKITGAGHHKERMSTEGISSGTCLVVLRRATGPEVKRVVLVK